ncbi:MAG: OsmC family peroxiredoxin [Actinobacteria bacterium]|nr:MAG: OsmC family peroxiredoxin [Actinomycetota bacterium]RIK08137.1 MAG: osmotically inducible protein C [Acidobacteriota bacterium]
MATITADLTEGSVVEIRDGRHVWHADEPPKAGGTDVGPNPYELLLGSLAACTCITLALYARHKEIHLESVSARFHYDKVHADDCEDCEDDVSGWLDRVRSEIFIDGDFTDEQRARLEQIAVRCPVHKTLQNGITFTEETVIVG